MPENEYMEPLTGEEIIIDLLEQIAVKLRADCRLRDSDSYGNGYSAKVQIHLEAYGLDAETVDLTVSSGHQQTGEATVIEEEVVVPVELDLNAVRERSEQGIPTLAGGDKEPYAVKKRYIQGADGRSSGGALNETLED